MQRSEPPTGQACRYANDRRFRKILSSKYAAGSQDSRVHVRPQGYGEWLCRMLSGTLGCCKSTVDLGELVGSHQISIGIRGIIRWHFFWGGQGGVAAYQGCAIHLSLGCKFQERVEAEGMDYAEFLKKMKKDKRSLANTEVCGCSGCRGDPCRFPNVLLFWEACNPVRFASCGTQGYHVEVY